MAKPQTDSWVKRAQRVLGESRRGTGAARRALLELLDAQPCALTALEIEDVLREGERPVAGASIYRTLGERERPHLVHKIQAGQPMARYEPVRLGAGTARHPGC